ncbi:AAA family ATPase [Thermocoleostomius sinensis]|uniref:Uncharacterized protein n=1 Tax=Thermocoleostomius sinensis A174 TaxID=2016057 RepID=A0A9E8ZA51_9CYAN|nr:hypothetical protein [Thermocoleostomius sinensis]WAL59062.1 hypothetical protein OXH18_18045 [Thermocoleostomius sinensis A174]
MVRNFLFKRNRSLEPQPQPTAPTSSISASEIGWLIPLIQTILQQQIAQPNRLQIRCAIREGVLLVLIEHLLHIEPEPPQIFQAVEQTVRSNVPKLIESNPDCEPIVKAYPLPVRLYLRVAGYQQPYDTFAFTLSPLHTSAQSAETTLLDELPTNSSPATILQETPTAPASESIEPNYSLAETLPVTPSSIEPGETPIIETDDSKPDDPAPDVEQQSNSQVSACNEQQITLVASEEISENPERLSQRLDKERRQEVVERYTSDRVTEFQSIETETIETSLTGTHAEISVDSFKILDESKPQLISKNLQIDKLITPNKISDEKLIEHGNLLNLEIENQRVVEERDHLPDSTVDFNTKNLTISPNTTKSDLFINPVIASESSSENNDNQTEYSYVKDLSQDSQDSSVLELNSEEATLEPLVSSDVQPVENFLAEERAIVPDAVSKPTTIPRESDPVSASSAQVEPVSSERVVFEPTPTEPVPTQEVESSCKPSSFTSGLNLEQESSKQVSKREADDFSSKLVKVEQRTEYFREHEGLRDLETEQSSPNRELEFVTDLDQYPDQYPSNAASSLTDPNTETITIQTANIQSTDTQTADPETTNTETTNIQMITTQAADDLGFDRLPLDIRDHKRRSFQSMVTLSNVLLVGAMSSFVVISGFYILSRPCVLGNQCQPLQRSQQLTRIALATIQTNPSALEVVDAYDQLSEANQLLETIPVWSRSYSTAQELIAEYANKIEELGLVVKALNQANNAAKKSLNPPHPVPVWREVQWMWREAIALLEQVPTESLVYSLAQTKRSEYESNLDSINNRVMAEQAAQDRIEMLKKAAEVTEARSQIISSIESWQQTTESWQAILAQLQQIPQGTMAFTEAQRLAKLYQLRLEAAENRRAQEERSVNAYNRALELADQARRLEQQQQWTQASIAWRDAIAAIKQVPEGTTHYSQSQALMTPYTTSLNQAEASAKQSTLLQTAQPQLENLCLPRLALCTYTLTTEAIRVHLNAPYDRTVAQAVRTAQLSSNATRWNDGSQTSQFLQSLVNISESTQTPIELYGADGSKFGIYDRSQSGYMVP